MVVRKFRMTTPQGVVEHLQYNFPQKNVLTLCDKMKMYIWGGYDGYGCFRWLNLVYLAT